MRLWHYELIEYLPNSQLLAQWRELNSIFKKQDKHILINYIYEYPKEDLQQYADMVILEMSRRGFNINSLDNYFNYFNVNAQGDKVYLEPPFKNHHNHRYLLQCFYNLQEKYDRGQKDFSEQQYEKLEDFIKQRNTNMVFEKYIKTKRESLCKKYGQDFYIDTDMLCNVGE